MDKKKVVSILLILTMTVTLASFVVYFSLESNRAYGELHKSRVYDAYLDANDIAHKLGSFTYNFYDNIYELNALLRPENSKYNETKQRTIILKCELLETYAKRGWLDISRDLMDLRRLAYLDKEIPFFNVSAFETVYNVIREAFGQVEWATLGKGEEILNETLPFLWELYYVLGVDQVEQYPPAESGLLALDWCFTELYGYWYAESHYGKENLPSYLTPPQTALEWSVGNATALHQELIQWDKYHRSRLYSD
jgi:hypothetical protein